MFLVRALDRFYRRIAPLDKLLSNLNVGKKSLALICHAGKAMCNRYSQILKQSFLGLFFHFRSISVEMSSHLVSDGVLTLRQQIVQQQQSYSPATAKTPSNYQGRSGSSPGPQSAAAGSPSHRSITLSDMLASLEQNVVEKLKAVLTTLHVPFSSLYRTMYFSEQ